MKLRDAARTAFDTWLTEQDLNKGAVRVEFNNILSKFTTDSGLPISKNLMGRLLSPHFLKITSSADDRTYYFVNKEL